MTRPNLIRVAGALALTLGFGACARPDTRFDKLTAGIAKDSVFKLMGVERPEKTANYLIAGKYVEAMYFPLPGATDSASIVDRKMSPVIVVDGKLVAWGWKQWDSMATANHIPVAPK